MRVRVVEVGEAVKCPSPDLLDTEPSIPWSAVARMRDRLAHHHDFDTDHAIVEDVVDNEIEPTLRAVPSMAERARRPCVTRSGNGL